MLDLQVKNENNGHDTNNHLVSCLLNEPHPKMSMEYEYCCLWVFLTPTVSGQQKQKRVMAKKQVDVKLLISFLTQAQLGKVDRKLSSLLLSMIAD